MKLKPGDRAPSFEAIDIEGKTQSLNSDEKSILLTFHRHAGCPPCNLRIHEHILEKNKLEKYNIRLLEVIESPASSILRDLSHKDVPFSILPDRERRLYNLYNVTPSISGFMRSFIIKPLYSIKAMFKHGYTPKFSEVTTMMPAEFLISSDGTVILSRYAKDFGDYLSFDDMYRALDKHSEDDKPLV